MSTILVPKGVMVEMIYTQGSQRMENVYWVTNGAVPTLANLQALWTIFRNWESASAVGVRTNSVALVHIALTSLDSVGAPFYEAPVSPAIFGTSAIQAAPPFMTVAIKHSTGKAGRAYRGRTYWIGAGASWPDVNGLISQGLADAFVLHYNALRANLLSAGWVWSICSRYEGVTIVNGRRRAVPRASGILTPITSHSCERSMDTNRHRKIPHQV